MARPGKAKKIRRERRVGGGFRRYRRTVLPAWANRKYRARQRRLDRTELLLGRGIERTAHIAVLTARWMCVNVAAQHSIASMWPARL
jgi:hypothetical protein